MFFFVLDLTIKYSGKFFFIIESFFLALKMRQILRRFYQLNKLLLYNENMLPQIKKNIFKDTVSLHFWWVSQKNCLQVRFIAKAEQGFSAFVAS